MIWWSRVGDTRRSQARLQAAAAANDRICVPGHNYAYQPEFQQLRQLVRDGSLGTIRAFWITYAIKHPEETASRYAGVLDEVMTHHAYHPRPARDTCPSARWEASNRLIAAHARRSGLDDLGVRLRDNAHLFASFAIDDDITDSWMFVVKALGTNGGATYSWRNAIFDRPRGTLRRALPAYEESYVHEDRAFVSAARGDDTAIVSTIEDAERSAALLTAAEQAAREHIGIRIQG